MTRIYNSMLVGLATVGVFALSVAPASAKSGYANVCPVLGTAFCTGSTVQPIGVAVDNSSTPSAGDVWVASGIEGVEEQRLSKFDAAGNQLAEVTESDLPGSAQPIFFKGGTGSRTIVGVAVDSGDGSVYVSSRENDGARAVTKFSSMGAFQFQITEVPGGAFEPRALAVGANGDLYVANDAAGTIDKFTASGSYLGAWSASGAAALAGGPEGNLYVGLGGEVKEYSATGTPVLCPRGAGGLPVTGGVSALALDPSDGHIFVDEVSAAQGYLIAEYASLCAAAPNVRLGEGEFGRYAPPGLGVSGATHRVYTAQFQANAGLVFEPVTLPEVTTGASATSVTRTSATVSGTVNPSGAPVTTCEFEYGTTESYGQSSPCSQELPLEGNGPVAVSAELSFALPPASLVHYRLKAANGAGEEVGEDKTFYTEALPPPVVGGLPASSVTQFAATLNGTLETAEGLVNYHFEYGTSTAYGQVEPVPDDYTPITTEVIPVAQAVGNLQAGTTYHYRLVASSPGGTEVAGPDETFTTLAVPVPAVETGGASSVGVGSATLSGTIDPHGWDTAYLFEYGMSSAYGSSWPTVQVDMGPLEGAQPVVVNVPNLLPGTTYHYRLVATDGGGTSYGPDMTFTTSQYPAPLIQEPTALRALQVPSDKPAKPSGKKVKKRGKAKKHKKKPEVRHSGKHGRARKKQG